MSKIKRKNFVIKKDINKKYKFNKLNIKEKIYKNVFFTLIGYVSSIITIGTLFVQSDDSVAMDNYQKGIIYLEDNDYKQAEQCFQKAYDIDNNLLDIKFYYACAEYWLEDYDKSYQILKENRNMLNENELTFYVMYEYSKKNYRKSSEYLNKIRQPENLDVLSFSHYIITSTELGFLNSYSEGISTFYANMVLLEAKINETKQLPSIDRIFHVEVDDTKHKEIEAANEVANRINRNVSDDVSMLKRCKLISYTQFIAHSIQNGEYTLPVYIFEDASDVVDFLTNQKASTRYVEILLLYTIGAVFEPRPEEIEKAIKIIVEKYNELDWLEKQEGKNIFTEDDRTKLEICETLLTDLENNCFDSNKDKYEIDASGLGLTGEDYDFQDVVKLWAKTFLNELYIKNLVKS